MKKLIEEVMNREDARSKTQAKEIVVEEASEPFGVWI